MSFPAPTRGYRKPRLVEILRYCGMDAKATRRGRKDQTKWFAGPVEMEVAPGMTTFRIVIMMPTKEHQIVSGRKLGRVRR